MNDFEFNCPHCDQWLEAPQEMMGEAIDCPSCNGSIELPKPAAQAETETTPERETKDCPYCGEAILATAVKCKHCGEFLNGQQSQPLTKATIRRKNEFAGVGCLIQGVGLVVIPSGLLFGLGVGLIVTIPMGIILLFIGSRQSSFLVCSHCGIKLTGTNITVCPACKATFK